MSAIIYSHIWNKIRKKGCSMKKGVPKTFAKFTGKHLCQSLFFNKAAGLRPSTLKKRIWDRCFPVYFAKFLRKTFFREHLRTTASVKQFDISGLGDLTPSIM